MKSVVFLSFLTPSPSLPLPFSLLIPVLLFDCKLCNIFTYAFTHIVIYSLTDSLTYLSKSKIQWRIFIKSTLLKMIDILEYYYYSRSKYLLL